MIVANTFLLFLILSASLRVDRNVAVAMEEGLAEEAKRSEVLEVLALEVAQP